MTRLSLTLVLLIAAMTGAARAAPPLAAYGALPAIEFMSLSPSGQRFAFVAVDGETRKLFVRKVGGDALTVANVGEAKVREIQWGDEDHLVVLVSRTIGRNIKEMRQFKQEATAAIVLDIKTGKTFRVFEKRADVYDAIAGFHGTYPSADGHGAGLFEGSSTVAWRNSLYRVDLAGGATRKVADGGAAGFGWVVDATGAVAARIDYDPSTKEWRLLPGGGGDRIAFRKAAPLGQIGTEGLGRAPGSVTVSDFTGDEDIFGEVSLVDGGFAPLPQGSDYQRVVHDPVTHLLIGAELKGDRGFLFFDPKRQARYAAIRRAFPGLQVRLISFDGAFDRFIVFTEGGDDSGAYWLLDAATGKAEALGQSYPAIGRADVGPTRIFAYKARDGLDIEAVLTLPPGRAETGLPLVVMPHGGPIGIEDEIRFDWWAQAFASRGYVVLQPNYRGSGGHGAAFRKAAFGQWGRKMQADLSDGVAALATKGIVDPRRVCIVGASYGGYAALAGATLQRGVYRCAVSYGGLSDLGELLARLGDSDISPTVRFERAALGARWAGDPELKEISPVYHADKADAPILLIHGRDDTVVPITQSEHMANALQQAGAPYAFTRLDGEDHWLSRQKTRTEMLDASVAFVEKWNPAN